MRETDAEAGNGSRVVRDHRVAERDGHEQPGELRHRKRAPALARRQRRLDTEPSDQNDREAAEEMLTEHHEQTTVQGHERDDGLRNRGEGVVGIHGSASLWQAEAEDRRRGSAGELRREPAGVQLKGDMRVDGRHLGVAPARGLDKL